MEEEEPHALEMGKEEKEAHEEKAEEKGRRALGVPGFPFSVSGFGLAIFN